MSQDWDESLRLQLRRERAEQAARDALTRYEDRMCLCGREWEEGARFCDACGASLGYTGKTERLQLNSPRIRDYGEPSTPFWK